MVHLLLLPGALVFAAHSRRNPRQILGKSLRPSLSGLPVLSHKTGNFVSKKNYNRTGFEDIEMTIFLRQF
jgi:hypothetical protein